MTSTVSGMTELTLNECLGLLREAEVGRLAVSAGEHPEVFPVNHVVDHGTVVFRTADGTKLGALVRDRNVTFEVDGYDGATGDAWSVIVKGHAVEVAAVQERFEALELPLFPWHVSPKHHVVRIVPVETTGRRFHAARPRAGQRAGEAVRRAASE